MATLTRTNGKTLYGTNRNTHRPKATKYAAVHPAGKHTDRMSFDSGDTRSRGRRVGRIRPKSRGYFG